MIETTIPEIDVTELMKRVRAEAARINSVMSWNGGSQTSLSLGLHQRRGLDLRRDPRPRSEGPAHLCEDAGGMA